MNFAHLHLLLNHFPVIGAIIGFGLFAISFFRTSADLRKASLIIFAAIALLSIPTFLTGFGAQNMIEHAPGVSAAMIERHKSSAMLSIWFIEITGALALIGLWQAHRDARVARWNVIAILLFSLLTVGLMARTGNTGGEIRHPEVLLGGEAPGTEGTAGSIVHVFEPNPQKFTDAMTSSKWWWAFMMDLHFIGLALIIGTVGILDLRIMGFAKQLPIAPLHKYVPWGLFGLTLNVVTGLLAFIGQPDNYIDSLVFWLKMLALLLLGVNVVAFYLTGIFDRVEPLGAGQSAPLSAKIIAASSLFLWFAVITFGRYIQLYSNTLPRLSFQ